MNVMVISQMFPCKRHPTSAIFFANLMKELSKTVESLIIVTPRPYVPKVLAAFNPRWRVWRLDPMYSIMDGVEIVRPFFPAVRGKAFAGVSATMMSLWLFPVVKDLVEVRKIDVLMGYNMIPEGIATVRLARRLRLPAGFWAIGSDVDELAGYSRINSHFSRRCLGNADLVLTECRELERKVNALSRDVNVRTFYKGIDLSVFRELPSQTDLRESLGLEQEKRYLLFVGRLIREKGIGELAACFNLIAKEDPQVDLILIGEEVARRRLEKDFHKAGTLPRVLFKGMLSRRAVARFMRAADVLILPSWHEGLPNVVLEAMASGVPVVASDVGGIHEVVQDGDTGLLVPAGDVESLTAAVLRILSEGDLRTACIRNASKLIVESFDVRRNVFCLREMLEDLSRAKRPQNLSFYHRASRV